MIEDVVLTIRKNSNLDGEFDARIHTLTNLTPNTEIAEEDVFIIGYPKSGHTWFQCLVAGVIYNVDLDYAPYSFVWELVPEHSVRPYYFRYGTPMFFKTHDVPRPKYRRVVYLVRDGRDAVTSYYHHLESVRRQKGQKTKFLKVAQGELGAFPHKKWHEHVEAWLANPCDAQMLIVKYEDLRQDTVRQLQRFCAFAGVEREEAFLRKVAAMASFERMREKEQAQGGLDKPKKDRPRPAAFVRRGAIGSYKDEMPPEVLEVFMHEAGDTLRKLGYI